MAYASGAQHGVFYQQETAVGVVPASPATIELPITGCGLELDKARIESARVRSDRMTTDVRAGNQEIKGAINFEFCYGAFDELLAGAFHETWNTNVLKAGCEAAKTFLIERAFTDIGVYLRFLGNYMTKFSLSIKPKALVTGSFDVTGLSGTVESAAFDTTPTAASTNKGFDSFTGALSEGGSSIGIVTGLDLVLDNGDQALYALMSSAAKGVSSGRAKVSGTMTAFFENNTLLNKFVNGTASSISLTLTDAAGNDYIILVPNVSYTGGQVPSEGEGPITLTMPFDGIYDAVTGTNLQVTRTPAT